MQESPGGSSAETAIDGDDSFTDSFTVCSSPWLPVQLGDNLLYPGQVWVTQNTFFATVLNLHEMNRQKMEMSLKQTFKDTVW